MGISNSNPSSPISTPDEIDWLPLALHAVERAGEMAGEVQMRDDAVPRHV